MSGRSTPILTLYTQIKLIQINQLGMCSPVFGSGAPLGHVNVASGQKPVSKFILPGIAALHRWQYPEAAYCKAKKSANPEYEIRRELYPGLMVNPHFVVAVIDEC